MKTSQEIINSFDVEFEASEINQASEIALDAASEFILDLDPDAYVEVTTNGEVYVNWYMEFPTYSRKGKTESAQELFNETFKEELSKIASQKI